MSLAGQTNLQCTMYSVAFLNNIAVTEAHQRNRLYTSTAVSKIATPSKVE